MVKLEVERHIPCREMDKINSRNNKELFKEASDKYFKNSKSIKKITR
jgi:hypothetical protein